MIGPESISVPSRSNRTTGKRMWPIVAPAWGNSWFRHGPPPSAPATERPRLDLPAGQAGLRSRYGSAPITASLSGASATTHALRTRRARGRGPTAVLSCPPPTAGARPAAPGIDSGASSIVPTSVRTMCRRNESAVTVKWSSSSRRSQARARISRRKLSCCVSVGVNARKSCSPRSCEAAAYSVSTSSGRGHQSARRREVALARAG